MSRGTSLTHTSPTLTRPGPYSILIPYTSLIPVCSTETNPETRRETIRSDSSHRPSLNLRSVGITVKYLPL